MIQHCSLASPRGRWILLVTILASGIVFLAGTAVIVALPAIQSHFGASITGLQWVVNAPFLALSALLLIGGSLGDQFGRKRIFLLGLGLFAAGAVLSVFAQSIAMLIAFQALQGIGSALMVPQTLAIINACFAENQRGQAIGLWAALSGGIAALGPWLGGWLIETFAWQAVFFMTVPLSIITLIITIVAVPESTEPETSKSSKLDWRGTLLILFGLSGIAYGLISAPTGGWNTAPVLASLISGAAAIILFILTESHQARPLVPLSIFRNPLIAGANLATFFLYFALNGVLFFSVLNLQQVQGYSPSLTGLSLLPVILLITLLAAPAGALADRIGPRWQMVAGPIIVAIGIAFLASGGPYASYTRHFFPGLVLLGLGMALVIAPLTKSALLVESQLSGTASGINNAISKVAGLMAVASLGALMLSTFSVQLENRINASTLTIEEQDIILNQSTKLGGIEIPQSFDESDLAVARGAIYESFVYGFRWVVGVCSALALSSALVALLTIHSPPRPAE